MVRTRNLPVESGFLIALEASASTANAGRFRGSSGSGAASVNFFGRRAPVACTAAARGVNRGQQGSAGSGARLGAKPKSQGPQAPIPIVRAGPCLGTWRMYYTHTHFAHSWVQYIVLQDPKATGHQDNQVYHFVTRGWLMVTWILSLLPTCLSDSLSETSPRPET